MADQENQDGLARAKAYLEELNGKLERKEQLTPRDKRFLLRTGKLTYKALVAPESLTPAERNRIRLMPPPDEVAANIRRVTGGAMSTPDEVFRKVVSSSGGGELTDDDDDDDLVSLVVHGFAVPASVYEEARRLPWVRKLGAAWGLAFNAVTTPAEREAHRAAVALETPERVERRRRRELEGVGPLETAEQRAGYRVRERRLKEEAAERGRVWDGQDEELFARAREEMMRMADELEGEECRCESCAAGGVDAVCLVP